MLVLSRQNFLNKYLGKVSEGRANPLDSDLLDSLSGPRLAVDSASPRRPTRLPGVNAVLSVPVLVAFGLFTLPARAVPAASMQLFRMDGHGVRAVPAISAAIAAAERPVSSPAATTATPLGRAARPRRTDCCRVSPPRIHCTGRSGLASATIAATASASTVWPTMPIQR